MEKEIDLVALDQELAKFGKEDEIRVTIQFWSDYYGFFDGLYICDGPKDAKSTIQHFVNHLVDDRYGIDYQIDR